MEVSTNTVLLESSLSIDKPLTMAILALGGQGGGVLSDWIVSIAEAQGWQVQSTSVPGVAQRTGSTIYYLEMLRARGNAQPIFALMPTPGDVDIVVAAELMEAGRAILRGFVNPHRTVLITSTHRSYAVVEKIVPGNGLADPQAVVEAAEIAAKRLLAFDMQSIADAHGSVISAPLLGALAAAEVLPFAQSAFLDAIRSGGKGVDASLNAFSASYERARKAPRDPIESIAPKPLRPLPDTAAIPELNRLLVRIRNEFPEECRSMIFAGVSRLTDYQGAHYANEYLDRMSKVRDMDTAHGGAPLHFAFTVTAAKYLAVALAYDDVIRVADLKTRASRFVRIRRDIAIPDEQAFHITEYFHPRVEEVVGMLPAAIGRFLESKKRVYRLLDRWITRGRRLRTDTVRSFLLLYLVSRARFLRPLSLRHSRELANIERWLTLAIRHVPTHYSLATEIIACRRLIKGYSNTHSGSLSKFDRVLSAVPKLAQMPDGADWLARLKQAALSDEKGEALDELMLLLSAR